MNNAVFVGNLAADPKLIKNTKGGERAVFSLALDEYNRDEDTPPTYVDLTVFSGRKDQFARNVAESLTKGKRVVVVARATTYKVEAEIDGETKQITKTSFVATSVGPDLRWQTAKVTKVTVDRDDDRGPEDEKPSRSARSDNSRSDSSRSEKSGRPSGRSSRSHDDDDF